jgi:D-alanine transaminase
LSRIAYVDGRFVPHARARIHVEDRGFQFGDSIYEVWSVRGGKLLDEDGHFFRLERSLSELRIENPRTRASYRLVIGDLLRRNRINDGLVYLQVSRGVARRDHAFPRHRVRPTIVLTAKPMDVEAAEQRAAAGIAVVTLEDIRWARCDIKTVNLLPNVLAKQHAVEAGAGEAWLVDRDGMVTEGSSSNAWIITSDGVLITRPADHAILCGITRMRIFQCAQSLGFATEERAFSLDEAKLARESFITSASSFVTPVVKIDEKIIGNGAPGSMAIALRSSYFEDN